MLPAMRLLATSLICWVLLFFTASAGELDAAEAATLRGKWPEAIGLYRPFAIAGNPEAQYWIGTIYFFGMGMPANKNEGLVWLRRATAQAHPAATALLGTILLDDGNTLEGLDLLKRAAMAGEGQFQRLGTYYLDERVPSDPLRADMWFGLSADNGNPFGIVDRDRAKAEMTPEEIAKAEELRLVCRASSFQDCAWE